MSLPAILYVADLRPLLGWTDERVIRFLESNGLAERMPTGRRRVYTTPQRIGAFSSVVLVALEAKWQAVNGGEALRLEDFSDLD